MPGSKSNRAGALPTQGNKRRGSGSVASGASNTSSKKAKKAKQPKVKAKKKPNWVPTEDTTLCRAYINVSEDPITGVDQKEKYSGRRSWKNSTSFWRRKAPLRMWRLVLEIITK